MHNAANRMRRVIRALSKFYHLKHDAMQGRIKEFSADFNPELEYWEGEADLDEPYYRYVAAMSEGIDELLAELKIKLSPVPPGVPGEAGHETLMAGAHMLKWDIEVEDAESGQYIGKLEFALYHRHDRFAVPGPAQISYLKARGGRTMMVG
ncbi:MAG: hypothetical protein R3185_08340, partial [Candidatus Thermoplasmatota archaeon]|nr:hypothetical protein [Candidatus Thermoplasmatota archaeon]